MKAKNYAIFSVLISTLLMCFVDGIISPPYLYKSIIKIILFLLIPLGYFLLYKDKAAYLKKLFVPKKKDFLLSMYVEIEDSAGYIHRSSKYFWLEKENSIGHATEEVHTLGIYDKDGNLLNKFE